MPGDGADRNNKPDNRGRRTDPRHTILIIALIVAVVVFLRFGSC